jgi:hypothetical protein
VCQQQSHSHLAIDMRSAGQMIYLWNNGHANLQEPSENDVIVEIIYAEHTCAIP